MEVVKQTKEKGNLWYFKHDKPWHKPGRIIQLCFRTPWNPKEEAKLPAVILNIRMHSGRPPSHDVGFYTIWSSGNISGMLTLKDIMPSRYMLKGEIPEESWKIFSVFYSKEYRIGPKDLFYRFYRGS